MEQPPHCTTAEVIDRHRRNRGLSYRNLATQVGLPVTSLYNRIRKNTLTVDDLATIAEALDTTASTLVAETEDAA